MKLTRFSHCAYLVVRVIQVFSLTHFQVEVDIPVCLEVVKLDLISHELENLVLNLVTVHEGLFSHGEASRHANLPLDLVYSGTRDRVKL